MFEPSEISRLRQELGRYAKAFDADVIPAADAVVVVSEASRIEKMAATLVALAAARAADTDGLERDGDLSPAHGLARRTGTTVTKASDALRTARRLRSQPALDAAARCGDVSPEQATAISDAAAADPAAEARLVEKSRQASLAELRTDCEQTRAAADRDAEERHRRIHAARYARRRSCPDGSGEIVYRSTRDEVAEIWAVIAAFANEAFRRARLAGQHEPSEAYAADGLLHMARAAAGGGAAPTGPPAGPEATAGPASSGPPAGPDGSAEGRGPAASGGGASVPAEARTPTPADDGCGSTPATEPTGSDSAAADTPPEAERAGAGPAPEDASAQAEPAESDAVPSDAVPSDGSTVESSPRPPGSGASGTLPGLAPDETAESPLLAHEAGPPKPVPPPGRARSPVPTRIVVRVDLPALLRGWVEGGETCDIAGIGPVAVSAVRAMMDSGDPFLAAVVTRGVDVVSVAHLGRRPNAHQRTALDWLAPTCRVLGCDASARLEYDHRHDWADTHLTLLGWLDRLCDGHHDKKTHDGWALVAGTGKRPMVPPEDPRHPRHLHGEPEDGG